MAVPKRGSGMSGSALLFTGSYNGQSVQVPAWIRQPPLPHGLHRFWTSGRGLGNWPTTPSLCGIRRGKHVKNSRVRPPGPNFHKPHVTSACGQHSDNQANLSKIWTSIGQCANNSIDKPAASVLTCGGKSSGRTGLGLDARFGENTLADTALRHVLSIDYQRITLSGWLPTTKTRCSCK